MDRRNPLVGVNGASASQPLKLSAESKTDISRLGGDPTQPAIRFSSPLLRTKMPTSSFRRAKVTFKAMKGYVHEWDQAGFIFLWPTPELPNPDAVNPGTVESAPLYLKAGIENINGLPLVACLSNNGELDFSSLPLERDEAVKGLTLEVLKYEDRLVVFVIRKGTDGTETKILHRVIYWGLKKDIRRETLWVGVYASRPDWNNDALEPLEVDITELEVEDTDGTVKIV
jgi:hypothetical protein